MTATAFLIAMLASSSSIADSFLRAPVLEAYPAPAGIAPSVQYSVHLTPNGVRRPGSAEPAPGLSSFVYQILNPAYLANGQPSGLGGASTLEHATSWTSFSFDGSVTVTVTNSKPFSSARILPSSAAVIPRVSGNMIVFTLHRPGQFAVDFCTTGSACTEANDRDLTNPLLIFANPSETLTNLPAPDALRVAPGLSVPSGDALPELSAFQSTLYFGPGVYDLGRIPLQVASNQTVFLAGGAYVKGFFVVADGATHWAIRGAGILSGENLPKAQCIGAIGGCPPMISAPNERRGVVEGITLIDSPIYNVALGGYNSTFKNGRDNTGTENTVRNVKIMSWAGNGDGIAAAYGSADPGSEISDSFLKVGDSGIHLNSSHLRVLNCTFWQLNNAAPIEISDTMGGNLNIDVTDVIVADSNVIRTEHATSDALEKAIFSAHHAGSGHLSHYTFRNIHVENSTFRLFSLAVRPGPYSLKNTALGSISDLSFERIDVTDPQLRPDLLQSYDRQHLLSGLRFAHVTIAAAEVPTPTITFNANRVMSLGGNATYDPLWRSVEDPSSFQLWLIDPKAAPPPAPQYSVIPLKQSALTPYSETGIGDFFGSGYASVLLRDPVSNQLGVWRDPAGTGPGAGAFFPTVYALQGADGGVAGVGDFDGDGYTDIVLWNAQTQSGKILLMKGARISSEIVFQPTRTSDWRVAGIGDFNQAGASDVLLRDSSGNLEILAFIPGTEGVVGYDFKATALFNVTTPYFNATWDAPSHGLFDADWTVAAVGDFQGLGYAGILWQHSQSNDLGLTHFTFDLQTVAEGATFDRLQFGSQLIATGDLDANGTADILLQSPTSSGSEIGVTYVNQWLTNLFENGPTIDPTVPSGWPWTLER